jgi:hypothetical protein
VIDDLDFQRRLRRRLLLQDLPSLSNGLNDAASLELIPLEPPYLLECRLLTAGRQVLGSAHQPPLEFGRNFHVPICRWQAVGAEAKPRELGVLPGVPPWRKVDLLPLRRRPRWPS